ncbi:rhomboid family intramembrane serine protease [Saprospiraceae bacterium]|nr:rhomboid family intramembrane serine protease [Saprospiraceae bacterium]
MEHSSAIGTILLILTGLTTYKGLISTIYKDKYLFWTDGILLKKENYRLISSGFLHANWIHYGFNMIGLITFSFGLEHEFGPLALLLLYFVCLFGGNILALYLHRNHGDYKALGASGAVSGIICSSIILFPNSQLSLILIPIHFPAWLMGILFIGITIFGIKRQAGNIGHEAHLGGALTGIIGTLIINPQVAIENWWIVLLLTVPTLAFLYLIVTNPAVMQVDNYWGESVKKFKRDLKTPPPKMSKQEELDMLLDKIRKSGIRSLTKKERARLDKLREM